MAGDWIKTRVDLPTDPAVIAMAAELDCDEFDVVGRLVAFWAWADRHVSEFGHAAGVTGKWIDRNFRHAGFAQAMCNVGWLVLDDTGATLPKWTRHNGKSAKERAMATERKRAERNGINGLEQKSAGQKRDTKPRRCTDDVAEQPESLSRCERDKTATREEKSINTPLPPAACAAGGLSASDADSVAAAGVAGESLSLGLDGHDVSASDAGAAAAEPEQPGRTGAVSLRTWLDACSAAGEQPVPADCAALRYAADIGLPDELVALHWAEFKARHLEAGAKRYRDWRRALLNSLRDNWFRLWRMDGAVPVMTTAAQQARLRLAAQMARDGGMAAAGSAEGVSA